MLAAPMIHQALCEAMTPALAIVEDDADLRDNLVQLLRTQGYQVWAVESAEAFYRQMLVQQADIVLVDVSLPGEDGISLVRHIRSLPNKGLIVLTCHGSDYFRVAAYDAGADVFLAKPVHTPELLAVLKSIANRLLDLEARPNQADTPWELDMSGAVLWAPDGRKIALTGRELTLLMCLMSQPGVRLSKRELQDHLGNVQDYQAIATLLSRLRKKVETELGLALPVRAIFAQGLVFLAPARFKSAQV